MLQGLWAVVILSFVSFALVFVCQFATKFYLQAKAKSTAEEIVQLQSQVNKGDEGVIKAQILKANNSIADYNTLAAAAPRWSKLLKAFPPLVPQGVEINSFNVNVPARSVGISGLSPTRDLVIQLYNNILKDDKQFYNIDYPFENIVNPTNVAFHFTFYIRDGLIQ